MYNEFKKVIVATSKSDSLKDKKIKFMKYAQENAEVHFMIGENSLFYDENILEYIDVLVKGYGDVKPSGIHIDIEPHTFDEWSTEKQKLNTEWLVKRNAK